MLCSDAGKFAVVAELTEHFRQRYDVIDVDGVLMLFEDGWGLVCCSNTQSVLVARCEARTPEGLARICRVMQEALRRYPEVTGFEWTC